MTGTAFDPAPHLVRVSGSDYLPVKWRIAWLRQEHSGAVIETEALQLDADFALFRATVRLPSGGSATGHGSETPADFRDHYEKAETKAIGRALAALGFGTQFCADHEAPPDRTGEAGSRPREAQPAPAGQRVYLQKAAAKAGLCDEQLEERSFREFGVPVHGLSRRDASHLAALIRGDAAPAAAKAAPARRPTPMRDVANGW